MSLIFVVFAGAKGFYGPVSEMHGFRQAQTAISASYILKGGPWLAYETPVLGPPWSIPFEFPLYQWAVALAAKAGLFPLVQSGRLVSILFFLSSLVPLYGILRLLKLGKDQALAVLSLYCVSPQYLFWSRTLMIESTVLALALYYIWFVMLYSEGRASSSGKWALLILSAAFGALAGMVKVTTFGAFWAAALMVLGIRILSDLRDGHAFLRNWRLLLFGAVVPVIAVYIWTSYADWNKALNPFGSHLTSSALKAWNFGTLKQRLSVGTYGTFCVRDLTNIMGSYLLIVPAVLAGLFCGRERRKAVLMLLVLFALPFFIFTNLYFVHDYYSYANGIFLLAAIGVACAGLMESGGRLKLISGAVLFSMIYVSSVYHYAAKYWPVQGTGYSYSDMKADFGAYTRADDVIIAFGADWSSEAPFYLERRGLMMAEWMRRRNPGLGFRYISQNLSGYRTGAVLFCAKTRDDTSFQKETLSGLGLDRYKKIVEYERCKVYYMSGPDGA
ncbi:MAG: hypothetical protein H3C68_06395 [Deltaproteobacteria bacterium]|nr:hypothetical protein [Deltaproteobacteria bacterium]MBZ0219615.1 glycosyltransferase family 39 protein [Deltaproteobacteria bacterium]